MAVIDLGQVKGDKGVSVRNRGAWNSTAQYINSAEYMDFVSYNGSLWMCVSTNTNSAPSKTNAKWNIAAEGVASIANNLTTTAAGSALDARQGPVLKQKIDKIYSDKLLTMAEVDLVTEKGFFVDALAVKELNSNLAFESGTMSMSGTPTGCTASVSGDYIKIGKMIFFQAEIRLNNNGTGATEVSIPCLPYPAKRHSTFATGYQTCVIKTSAGNNYAVTKAGTYGDSRGLIFYTTQDGRTYTVKQNEIITSNTVIIVGGSYIAAD